MQKYRPSSGLRIQRAFHESARAGASHEFITFYDHSALRQHYIGHAGDFNSFEHRVVNPHVVGLDADRMLAVRIEHDQIGVASHRDRALTWIQAEKLGGCGGDNFYEAIHTEPLLRDTSRVNQTHTMLDPRAAVGDFREVVLAKFFLFLEAKRTVIGRHDL